MRSNKFCRVIDGKLSFYDTLSSYLIARREIMDQKNPPVKEFKDRTKLSYLLSYISSIILIVGGTLLTTGGGNLGVFAVLLGVIISEFSHYYAAQGGGYRALKALKKE